MVSACRTMALSLTDRNRPLTIPVPMRVASWRRMGALAGMAASAAWADVGCCARTTRARRRAARGYLTSQCGLGQHQLLVRRAVAFGAAAPRAITIPEEMSQRVASQPPPTEAPPAPTPRLCGASRKVDVLVMPTKEFAGGAMLERCWRTNGLIIQGIVRPPVAVILAKPDAGFDSHVGSDREIALVEQAMQVRPEQQAVADVVRSFFGEGTVLGSRREPGFCSRPAGSANGEPVRVHRGGRREPCPCRLRNPDDDDDARSTRRLHGPDRSSCPPATP